MEEDFYTDLTSSTILSNGYSVRVWHADAPGGNGIALYAQVFDTNFGIVKDTFQVSADIGTVSADPNIISLNDGGFLVVWATASSDSNIHVARFDENGEEVWAPRILNISGQDSFSNTVAVQTEAGNIFLIWNNTDLFNGGEVFGVRLDETGGVDGNAFRINSTTSNDQSEASVSALAGGGFVVVWDSVSSGSFIGRDDVSLVAGQIFDDEGMRVGSEFFVSTETSDADTNPQVSGSPDGGFVVTWSEQDGRQDPLAPFDPFEPLPTSDAYFRIYGADGNPASSIIPIDNGDAFQAYPWVEVLSNGSFLIGWSASVELRLQLYSPTGNAIGAPVTLDDYPLREQFFIEIESTPAGRVFLHWQTDNGFGGFAMSGSALDFELAGSAATDGTAGDDSLVGTSADDVLAGLGGADTLNGGSGDDELSGGDGADTLEGGAGADTIDGGAGVDTASYASSASAVTANLSSGTFSRGDAAGDVLQNIENLIGSAFADRLIGNDEINHLIGSAGGDTLVGGGGADILEGGDGDDTFFAGASDDGDDIAVGGAGSDVIATGAGNDLAVGDGAQASGFQSSMNANGADTILGGDGSDTLLGGSWQDGNGNGAFDRGEQDTSGTTGNVVYGGAGADLVYGASGADTLGGGAGGDTIEGGSGTDILYGGQGATDNDDVFSAGAGSDTVFGSAGADLLQGQSGNDVLFGGSGTDSIEGGDGSDSLYGGTGDDLITGGAGADAFFFGGGHGDDTITDFDVTGDVLFLGNAVAGFTDLSSVQGAATEVTQGGQSGLLIDTGDGNSIFLVGIGVSDLTESNVSF